ncbi:MAG: DNA polymerase III subunit alpha [Caldilineaceae bacterium]|nr:DNA polymerase III subunit alpha [Caldilineaceae bacterium]
MVSQTAPTKFTHLCVHSWYSLLGATASIEALVARAVEDGMERLALTDTNVLYGAVAFARSCREAGIQPILGMTALVRAPGGGVATTSLWAELTLLATGPAGYRSLCRLSSAVQAAPDRSDLPARGLDWDTLKANRDGLICLSGGRRGWVDQLLRMGNQSGASRVVSHLAGIFGENAWLALELHRPADEEVARELVGLASRFGLGAVAVQPVYCLLPEERARLRLLAAIARNTPLDTLSTADLPDGGDPAIDLHWLSPAALAERFAAFPKAVAAAAEIAAACGPALPDGRPIWPVLALPQQQSPDATLAVQARAGLGERYAHSVATPEQIAKREQRLRDELDAIARHGFAPLFLLVADIVRFARQHDVPVSTRGSVANSLVAYTIGITTVDPVEHDLLFERFLNPARTSLPDIDLDFCSVRRDEVLDYVRRTYGEDQVALVATISTFRLRSALRETAKAYGLDEATTDRLARTLPEDWHPDPRRRGHQTLEGALARVPDPALQPVVRAAFELLNQPDHLSVHPGGVVITPGPLTDYVPVQWAPKGFLITQFDHNDVEAIGLPKIDLLGIRALTVLADTVALVRAHYGPGLRVENIPMDDRATGDLLERGETMGVFQCESAGAQRTLRQLKARTVQDLAVANAFFKPGPALGGMAQHFIRRYRGEEPVRYLHPALEPILRRTKGVLIFQEQILRIAREIAGLSWAEADRLRKGMSKFHADEMAAIRARFIEGCMRPAPEGPAFTEVQARTLWEQVEPFSGYGFNQGHATAYADVSYRSAYLKTHWPAAFLCARLANWGGYHYPSTYVAEARRLGIAVRPPHVNHSGYEFTLTVEEAAGAQPILWMGLGQVRDLRQAAVQAIIDARAERPFRDLTDLLARVPLQAREIVNLVQCGALDGLGVSRAALLAEADHAVRAGAHQMTFGFMAQVVPDETPAQRLAWEQQIVGFPVSVHPLDVVQLDEAALTALARVPNRPGQPVTVAGVRLPGGTGGKGFFLADRTHYCIAVQPRGIAAPPAWQPLRISGRWLLDTWGGGTLQIESIELLH